jgi:hypothetical protein
MYLFRVNGIRTSHLFSVNGWHSLLPLFISNISIMSTENRNTENPEGWQSEGESLNTGSAEAAAAADQQPDKQGSEPRHGSGSIHNNALHAASMGRSATAAAGHHSGAGMEQTGTNNDAYTGPIGAGAGGSVGTGYSSGRSAVDPSSETLREEGDQQD